mgnify:CR=1 FL=1
MNGSCAGGTGAFIDQMATLLKMSAEEMNKAAEQAQRTYTIASRCGVFAKSDVQPLINQGARTEDIAASIYKAVVNQTIAGLAQGRPIKGNILYLGGPLTFSTVLRKSFDEALNVTGTCPENQPAVCGAGRCSVCRQGVCAHRGGRCAGQIRRHCYLCQRAAAVRQQGGVRGFPRTAHVP